MTWCRAPSYCIVSGQGTRALSARLNPGVKLLPILLAGLQQLGCKQGRYSAERLSDIQSELGDIVQGHLNDGWSLTLLLGIRESRFPCHSESSANGQQGFRAAGLLGVNAADGMLQQQRSQPRVYYFFSSRSSFIRVGGAGENG
jgi:hypothetical protein